MKNHRPGKGKPPGRLFIEERPEGFRIIHESGILPPRMLGKPIPLLEAAERILERLRIYDRRLHGWRRPRKSRHARPIRVTRKYADS